MKASLISAISARQAELLEAPQHKTLGLHPSPKGPKKIVALNSLGTKKWQKTVISP
jgi:hypothetical protein